MKLAYMYATPDVTHSRVTAICTGEVYGEAGLSFARMKSAMRFAQRFGAAVNVGRLRGRYQEGVEPAQTLAWITEAIQIACQWAMVFTILTTRFRHYGTCLITITSQ